MSNVMHFKQFHLFYVWKLKNNETSHLYCGKSNRLAKFLFLDSPLLHFLSFFSSSFCTFFSSVFPGGRPGFFFCLAGVFRLVFLGSVVISFRGEQLSVCRPSPFKTSEYTATANVWLLILLQSFFMKLRINYIVAKLW